MDAIESGTLERSKFGLLDTETSTWLGTDQGPLVYDDMEVAKVARQVIAAQIPCSPLRISIEPFTSATKKLDEIKRENTLEQALDLIDRRGF